MSGKNVLRSHAALVAFSGQPKPCCATRELLRRGLGLDERIGFVALSGGARLASMPDTATLEICLIRALLAPFSPACDAHRNFRERPGRVSHLTHMVARSSCHPRRSALFPYGTRRPTHRGTCAHRFTRLLPCPFPFSEAPLPQAHTTAV